MTVEDYTEDLRTFPDFIYWQGHVQRIRVLFACGACRKVRQRHKPGANGQIMYIAVTYGEEDWILHQARGTPEFVPSATALDPRDPKAIVFKCRNAAHPPRTKSSVWVISRAQKAVADGFQYVHV